MVKNEYRVEIRNNDDQLLMSQSSDLKKDSFTSFDQIITHAKMLVNSNESIFLYVKRGQLHKFTKVSNMEELIIVATAIYSDFLEQQEIVKNQNISLTQQLVNAISEKMLGTTAPTLTEDEEENIDYVLDFMAGDFSALGETSTPDGAFDAYMKIANGIG